MYIFCKYIVNLKNIFPVRQQKQFGSRLARFVNAQATLSFFGNGCG